MLDAFDEAGGSEALPSQIAAGQVRAVVMAAEPYFLRQQDSSIGAAGVACSILRFELRHCGCFRSQQTRNSANNELDAECGSLRDRTRTIGKWTCEFARVTECCPSLFQLRARNVRQTGKVTATLRHEHSMRRQFTVRHVCHVHNTRAMSNADCVRCRYGPADAANLSFGHAPAPFECERRRPAYLTEAQEILIKALCPLHIERVEGAVIQRDDVAHLGRAGPGEIAAISAILKLQHDDDGLLLSVYTRAK